MRDRFALGGLNGRPRDFGSAGRTVPERSQHYRSPIETLEGKTVADAPGSDGPPPTKPAAGNDFRPLPAGVKTCYASSLSARIGSTREARRAGA